MKPFRSMRGLCARGPVFYMIHGMQSSSIIPWKKVGVPTVLAKGYGKSFTKQDFIDHAGKPTDFYFFDQPSWAVVLAITKGGAVLNVRQFKQGAEDILLELPGGQANFADEDPSVVMRRELFEETGYRPKTVTPLGWGWMNSRNSHTKFFCFLAEGCEKIAVPNLDAIEQIEVSECSLAEWLRMVTDTEIISWDSCFTTMRALSYLGFHVVAQ